MSYEYFQDFREPWKYSVADNSNNEWRGVITRTEDRKWKSENGNVFDHDKRMEAANQ